MYFTQRLQKVVSGFSILLGTVDRFKESSVTFADPDYFKMFQYQWVAGNSNALSREKTVVLTESVAKKYFGDKNPMNQVINFNNEFDVTVSGVIKDPPLNTDFPFRIIISASLGANKRGWDNWGAASTSINCYVTIIVDNRNDGITHV